MFIQLAEQIQRHAGQQIGWPDAVNAVFQYRPVDLLNYLEKYWALSAPDGRDYVASAVVGDEVNRRILSEPNVVGLPPENTNLRPSIPNVVPIPENGFDQWFIDAPTGVQHSTIYPAWRHIIYAYTIENTRIFDILKRVLRELTTGERLGRPNSAVLSWARNTEELFFADRLGHWIFSPISRLRDDSGAIRRNAYYRMLGMELNHGTEDGRPYPYPKSETANRELSRTFEQLLREVWRGYVNRDNTSGPRLTDDATIADLALKLHDMLRDRRLYGSLAREEFYSVATLSWFHLTVTSDNAVMEWLNAQGNNAAERLRAIGERVGLAPHTRAYNFFEMADALSEMLIRIEYGEFNDIVNVPTLYRTLLDPLPPPLSYSNQMLTIINHWSAATGRNMKEFVGVPAQVRA